jgi:hypothetical protein
LRATLPARRHRPHLELVASGREVRKEYRRRGTRRAPGLVRAKEAVLVGQRLGGGVADAEEIDFELRLSGEELEIGDAFLADRRQRLFDAADPESADADLRRRRRVTDPRLNVRHTPRGAEPEAALPIARGAQHGSHRQPIVGGVAPRDVPAGVTTGASLVESHDAAGRDEIHAPERVFDDQ